VYIKLGTKAYLTLEDGRQSLAELEIGTEIVALLNLFRNRWGMVGGP